jgi:hypothetical protein
MDIKSLKMSDNMQYSDCIEAIMPPILNFIEASFTDKVQDNVNKIKHYIDMYAELIMEFLKGEEDNFALISEVERKCANSP